LKGGYLMVLQQGDLDRIRKMQANIKNNANANADKGLGITGKPLNFKAVGLSNPGAGTGGIAGAIDRGRNPAPTVTGSTGPPQTVVSGQGSTGGNSNGMIDSLYDSRINARLSKLRAARDQAVGKLNQERNQLAPAYAQKRNQADVVNTQNVQRLKEMMAADGLGGSGENVTAQTGLASARNNALGRFNLQEQQSRDDIGRRMSDLYNPENENALRQSIEAERMGHLVNQFNTDRQFGLQEGQLLGNYNGQRTLQGQQFDYGQQTDQRNFDYGVGRDQVMDNRYDQQFDFQKSQQEWDNAFREGQFDFQKAQQLWNNNFQNKSFEQGVNQFAQQMGLNYSQLNQRDKEFVAEQAYRNEAMQLNKDQFKHTQMQDAVNTGFKRMDNEARRSQENQTKPIGAGDFKTNPDFAQDYAFIINNPEQARQALEQNAQSFIEVYGLDGYKALYERAGGY
jgi:hypothetical protein